MIIDARKYVPSQEELEEWEAELRADEERAIRDEIEAEEEGPFEEEEDGWDDPELREAFLEALEKDD